MPPNNNYTVLGEIDGKPEILVGVDAGFQEFIRLDISGQTLLMGPGTALSLAISLLQYIEQIRPEMIPTKITGIGDPISEVMNSRGMTFPEAVEFLGKELGIRVVDEAKE